MKKITHEDAISALKIYVDLTKQLMPAVKDLKQLATIKEFNDSIEKKLKG